MAKLNTTNQMVAEFARVLDRPAAPKFAIKKIQTCGGDCFLVMIDGLPSGNGGYATEAHAKRFIRDQRAQAA